MVGSMDADRRDGQLRFAKSLTERRLNSFWQGDSEGVFIGDAGYVGLMQLSTSQN